MELHGKAAKSYEEKSMAMALRIKDVICNGTAQRAAREKHREVQRSGAKEVHRTVMHGDTLIWAMNGMAMDKQGNERHGDG
jgi:hypothetical protein